MAETDGYQNYMVYDDGGKEMTYNGYGTSEPEYDVYKPVFLIIIYDP